jgi:hypothetical protein
VRDRARRDRDGERRRDDGQNEQRQQH